MMDSQTLAASAYLDTKQYYTVLLIREGDETVTHHSLYESVRLFIVASLFDSSIYTEGQPPSRC